MAFDPNALLKIEDITSQFDPADMNQNHVEAIATAIPFLFWLPAVTKHDSPYLKWLANQTLAVFLLGVVVGIVTGILSIIPFIGALIGVLLSLCYAGIVLANFVLTIIGKAYILPVIGAVNLDVFK